MTKMIEKEEANFTLNEVKEGKKVKSFVIFMKMQDKKFFILLTKHI